MIPKHSLSDQMVPTSCRWWHRRLLLLPEAPEGLDPGGRAVPEAGGSGCPHRRQEAHLAFGGGAQRGARGKGGAGLGKVGNQSTVPVVVSSFVSSCLKSILPA